MTETQSLRAEIARLEDELSLFRKREQLRKEADKYAKGSKGFVRFVQITVCHEFGLQLSVMRSKVKHHHLIEPRQIAMYLAYDIGHARWHISETMIAKHFKKKRWTVSHAVRAITDRLSCPHETELRRRVENVRKAINL